MINLDISPFVTLPNSQGLWISFEGIEGCGKSTQIKLLESYFQKKNKDVLLIREPGGTKLGEDLRAVILGQTEEIDPLAESFLFLASRTQLLRQKILPWLVEKNRILLMDRYLDSTLVYQGWAAKKNFSEPLKLHHPYPLCHLPHLTFYLAIPPELSFERQEQRKSKKDYFEKKGLSFYQNLAEGYEKLAEVFPDRIKKIKGDQSIEEVHQSIISHLTGTN